MRGTARWVTGGVAAVLGIVGLFMAARAHDDGVYLFGFALFAFALLFIFSQIRQGYDAAERAARNYRVRPGPPPP